MAGVFLSGLKNTDKRQIITVSTYIYTPEPGFEPGSKAPQASRISKLPHSDIC